MPDKLREVPLAEIPIGREVREVRLLAKLLDDFANPIRRRRELAVPTAIFRNGVRRLVQEEGAQLVDVLPREEYEEEHLPGAINIPLKELDQESIAQLRQDALVIVYCHDYQ